MTRTLDRPFHGIMEFCNGIALDSCDAALAQALLTRTCASLALHLPFTCVCLRLLAFACVCLRLHVRCCAALASRSLALTPLLILILCCGWMSANRMRQMGRLLLLDVIMY
jgi:hypothetical protein